MKKITVKQIMKLRPCYTEDEVKNLFKKYGAKKSVTVLEIAESGHIIQDIFWLLLRPEYIPEKELHLFSVWCATRALRGERKTGREPDKRSWDAIKAKKKWIDGKIIDEELIKCNAAAYTASTYAASVATDAADAYPTAAAASAAAAYASASASAAAAYASASASAAAAYASASASAAAAYASASASAAAYASASASAAAAYASASASAAAAYASASASAAAAYASASASAAAAYASASASASAGDKERKTQLKHLIKMIKEHVNEKLKNNTSGTQANNTCQID